ncbi:hypothetical protein HDV02_000638 [Globomyces sp. JEL0801]|nr:hypothetical protein HDV02_000638 [Globomyces sp. JEL0801]
MSKEFPIVSKAEKLQPTITEFSINLPDDTLVVPLESTHDTVKMQGVIKLDLNDTLSNIDTIEFRFIAAVITRYPGKKATLRGFEKLFERKLTLSADTELSADIHEFNFDLNLPTCSPPTIDTEKLKIQYLLVVNIKYVNYCCDWILGKKFTKVRQDIYVRSSGLDDTFEPRVELLINGNEDLKVELLYKQLEGILNFKPFTFSTRSPNENIVVTIDPIQPLDDNWNIHLQILQNVRLSKVEYILSQTTNFIYTEDETNQVELHAHTDVVTKIISKGVVDTFKKVSEDIKNETLYSVVLSVLNRYQESDNLAIEDNNEKTKVAIVEHSLTLVLHFDAESYEIELPIQVTKDRSLEPAPVLLKDDEKILDTQLRQRK